ncbi:MAG TPA: hypothetical protein DEV98_03390 [Clostridiales bacterium]|nr:hypothetical protein [Clostridiales bacterium]
MLAADKAGGRYRRKNSLKILKNTTNRTEKTVYTITRAKNRKTKDRPKGAVGKRIFARKKGISFWAYTEKEKRAAAESNRMFRRRRTFRKPE